MKSSIGARWRDSPREHQAVLAWLPRVHSLNCESAKGWGFYVMAGGYLKTFFEFYGRPAVFSVSAKPKSRACRLPAKQVRVFHWQMRFTSKLALFNILCALAIQQSQQSAHAAEAGSEKKPSGAPEISVKSATDGRITQMLSDFAQQIEKMSESLKPLTGFSRLRGLSRRGDLRLFSGDFAGALADYSEMISLDSAQDTPHWRRGIALYFNRQFNEGAAQFERYHAYDARDRENGLWKFLCDAQAKGRDFAQANMLPYRQFDRHPFPDLYALYGGSQSLAEYNKSAQPHAEASRMVKFFHLYYRGLHQAQTDRKAALADIREAVALFAPDEVPNTGPGYMWHCARLHIDFIAQQ